jgi:guanylate kinase
MAGKLVIISGPSGAGKSTLVQHLKNIEDFELEFSISATTRAQRGDEKNGVDYYFLSIDEFKNRIDDNEFLEWEEVYNKQLYGTLKSEITRLTLLDKNILFDVDVAGATNIQRNFKDKSISIFIKPPSTEELEKRLKSRNTDSEANIQKRLKKTRLELTYARRFNHTIVNDQLEKTKEEVENIIREFLL